MPNLSELIRDKKLCNFAKLLDQHHYKYNIAEIFTDFLQISVCALSFGKLEQTYHQTIRRYEKKDLEIFPKLLAEIFIYFKDCEMWADPFGEIYEAIAGKFKRSNFGQFFTPPGVCEATAECLLFDSEEKDSLRICDPASGSGRMLLAFHSKNKKPNHYTAVDIDRTCVFMTALNMLHHGMKGIVIHGNSITLECWAAYEVNPFLHLGMPSIRPLTAEAGKKILCAPLLQTEIKKPEPERTQMLLDF